MRHRPWADLLTAHGFFGFTGRGNDSSAFFIEIKEEEK